MESLFFFWDGVGQEVVPLSIMDGRETDLVGIAGHRSSVVRYFHSRNSAELQDEFFHRRGRQRRGTLVDSFDDVFRNRFVHGPGIRFVNFLDVHVLVEAQVVGLIKERRRIVRGTAVARFVRDDRRGVVNALAFFLLRTPSFLFFPFLFPRHQTGLSSLRGSCHDSVISCHQLEELVKPVDFAESLENVLPAGAQELAVGPSQNEHGLDAAHVPGLQQHPGSQLREPRQGNHEGLSRHVVSHESRRADREAKPCQAHLDGFGGVDGSRF
mmetsp:Transcript_24034/g.56693  ORF Transcript_24034/g.56693 Transcript_24034/m.56693 type:complete len:269 (-) Transcript_24034:182-988(-)